MTGPAFIADAIRETSRVGVLLAPTMLAITVALACLARPVTADVPASPDPSQRASCEYTNFIIYQDFPDALVGVGVAPVEVLRQAEERFARELEAVGFHRVTSNEMPWLYVRAVLQKSTLAEGAVSGVVEFKPTADFNRDHALALSDSSIPDRRVGELAAFEGQVRSGRLVESDRIRMAAEEIGKKAWSHSGPLLMALCK